MLIALLLLPSQQQIQTWAMSGFLSLKVRHIICFQDLSSEAGLFWPRSLVGFYVVHFISDSYRKSRERFQIGNKLNLRTNCFIFLKKQNLVVVFFFKGNTKFKYTSSNKERVIVLQSKTGDEILFISHV